MLETPAATAAARDLSDQLDQLELVPFSDSKAAFGPAVALEKQARELGADALERRAQLIQADVLGRIGKHTASGQLIREINAWAEENGDTYLLARSHRMLAMFFDAIGDAPSAWQNALRAVELLDETATEQIRAEHLFGLGMALQRTRSFDDARNRYQTALKLAERTGDVHLRLKILNNLAWLEDDAGDFRRSSEVGERMTAFASEHGVVLDAGCLDTIAHAQLMLGEYAAAERTLQPLLQDQHLEARPTEGLAEALRTAAEAQRLQGNLDSAQATLDRCIRFCEDRGLGLNRVEAMEEQGSLYAAHGNFEKAFRQHIAFHAAYVALLAAEREANSRTLQAVFETNEARHEGQRFRELALRDPLTGLPNRRYVDSELPAILGNASDQRTPLALGLLDIDHFKLVNDTYSHAVGDQVLMQIGKILGEAALASRPAGLAARMGGEEFLLVLTGELLGERFEALRKRIESHSWDRIAQNLAITVSVGVTKVRPGRATQSALLGRADRFLYIAKNAGRNKVVIDPD